MIDQTGEFESLSDACLSYLISDPEELSRFMSYAGYGPETLTTAVGSREFALGLFDYFAGNEPALLAMCANANIDVERFMRHWHKLNHGM